MAFVEFFKRRMAKEYQKSAIKKTYGIQVFFISNTFISDARLKLAKNQENAKQNPEAELLLFKNYSHSSSTSSNNNRIYPEKEAKEQVRLHSYD